MLISVSFKDNDEEVPYNLMYAAHQTINDILKRGKVQFWRYRKGDVLRVNSTNKNLNRLMAVLPQNKPFRLDKYVARENWVIKYAENAIWKNKGA